MPRPKRSGVCNEPGCPNDTKPGRRKCPTHDPGPWAGDRKSRLPPDWQARRARVLERDQYTCQECGARATHVDHIRPGDTHDDGNLQSLCESCHARKSAREGRAAQLRARRP